MSLHATATGTMGSSTPRSVPVITRLCIVAAIALSAGHAFCQEASLPAPRQIPAGELEAEKPSREEGWAAMRARRLKRIQAIEGERFSQEKFDAYRHRKAAGVVLTVAFPALLITSLLFALEQDPGTIMQTGEDVGGDPPRTDAQESFRVVAWVTLVAGILSGVIGISLLVSGVKGKHRQIYLRDNTDPAPAAVSSTDLRLFLSAGRGTSGGGLGFEL